MKGERNFRRDAKWRGERMYIEEGLSLTQIQKKLGVKTYKTMRTWRIDGEWDKKREDFLVSLDEQRLAVIMADESAYIKGVLDGLNKIKKAAIESVDDGDVTPKKFSEATDGYINAAKFERDIRVDAFRLEFLQAVAKIIEDEISDPEIIKRIGEKFRKLVTIPSIGRTALPSAGETTHS